MHGDDFTSLAQESNLNWFRGQLEDRFSIKDRGILGPDRHDLKQIRLLNRVITWTDDSITFEADQRHGEILIKALGLNDAKEVITPGITRPVDEYVNESKELDSETTTLYRACAARCNFLGLDRPDLQYSAKEVSRGMSKPTEDDMTMLKRLARYIKKYPRAALIYKHQLPPKCLRVYSDSNWAGCIKTRKSTQGGTVMINGCCVKSWSSTQAIISLSSGEAEFYGIVKAASVGLGVQATLKDLGVQLDLEVYTDATAAKGIASRKGLGKTRHIAVHFLWIQERVANGDFKLLKVWGGVNPADLMTKYLTREVMNTHMNTCNLKYLEGRSSEAPVLAS